MVKLRGNYLDQIGNVVKYNYYKDRFISVIFTYDEKL